MAKTFSKSRIFRLASIFAFGLFVAYRGLLVQEAIDSIYGDLELSTPSEEEEAPSLRISSLERKDSNISNKVVVSTATRSNEIQQQPLRPNKRNSTIEKASNRDKNGERRRIYVKRRDKFVQPGRWDGTPIVLESHKLIFLTTPKVSCTVFKQLFRRMMGYENWKSQDDTLPHNPQINGLKYLHQYSFPDINEMLNSPDWTKAVFVREPKERILSSYLDKTRASNNWYLQKYCCQMFHLPKDTPGCGNYASLEDQSAPVMSFETFLQELVPKCPDNHWTPQFHQLPKQVWPLMTFIGRFDNLYNDTKQLLQTLISTSTGRTAWEEYGKTGWGPSSNFSIFDPSAISSFVTHGTSARERFSELYTARTETLVEEYYRDDFNYERFHFSRENVER